MKTTQSTKKMHKKLHNRVCVMAFGTFDIVHPGHLHYLRAAKKFGDELIVVIARDSTVKKMKGAFPINDEHTRMQLIGELRCVDRVVLGNEGVIYDIVKEINPDIIALGYDQHVDTQKLRRELKKRKLNCKVVRLKPVNAKKFKSSIIKEKIRKQ
jgi:FAD synthetase